MKISPSSLLLTCLGLASLLPGRSEAQKAPRKAQPDLAAGKPISQDLFGIFFEDINYAADGGLYAELVQNRSFEYTPNDNAAWHSLTAWEFLREGYSFGTMSVETAAPVNPSNPHYVTLHVENEMQKGLGLKNSGFDGIPVKAGDQYNFSVQARVKGGKTVPLLVQLRDKEGGVLATASLPVQNASWQPYRVTLTPTGTDAAGSLVVVATGKGTVDLDLISLFPQKTFKNRPNGMRADLAQAIADLQPKFVRFPGGCLAHGDGLENMYRWKNTIGPLEQRVAQRNIWNYHQTAGLGYFEYFQFCEDIGAKPLPVVPAAVSCQNSGGTWRIGGTGQQSIAMAEMPEYVQEVLDLIEYANGPTTSTWGAKRAAAGHPESFHLEYVGVGNEDKQTPEFRERFKLIYDAVKQKHPEVTVIGTVGPAPRGEDFDQGWTFANQLAVPMVDEHYYESPEWFLKNNRRYDSYDRKKSTVYLGEYASRGNTLFNALAEAAYMTSLERNGDVVRLASYAPLLAKEGHTQWNPDLIYFNNSTVCPTANYYVQQLFSRNQGSEYFGGVLTATDSAVVSSCVRDANSGDVILKLVNSGATAQPVRVDLSRFKRLRPTAEVITLSGPRDAKNTFASPQTVVPKTAPFKASGNFAYTAAPYSLTVIRVKGSDAKPRKDVSRGSTASSGSAGR
ncbi:alpha-L-arabinofuranosidase C-terminal domain-containing protein [Hymenobacter mucosus]|uniref:non-reducing end alpha-L-arabinofuranosidase n=1 Tax=Hymenobacter mucosus TaxID=1411120 RepID=A0A238ZBK3_9BACT|nr:alpha-L-arabinofuranosidase C-terminal domain-containing protein [Hymenobacter mucosus]SNR80905.1 Alpha-L-arabinofuranosidase [Hymenobacter mucosus]